MKTLNLILAIVIGALMILMSSAIIATTGLDISLSITLAVVIAFAFTALKSKFPMISFVTVCGEIAANILNSCDNPVQAGTKDRGVVINFDDVIGVTYAADGETVEDLLLASGAVGYQIEGKNNSIEPDTNMVKVGFNKMFDHMVRMKGFDVSPATKNQINSMKDGRFVVITENYFKGASGNAAFEIYGLTAGLELTEIGRNPNSEETQGAFDFLFFTDVNKEPKLPNTLFITDYATSKAVVDAILV